MELKIDLNASLRTNPKYLEMNAENKTKTVNIGILGFGTVGQGTWKHLEENNQFWEKILGVQVIPKKASVRSLTKERKIKISDNALTTD